MAWRDAFELKSCRKWITLQRVLLVVVFLLLIVIIILAALLGRHSSNSKNDVCITEACINAASSILEAMDTSVDPCQDFYSYSCGGWVKNHPLLPGESYHSVLTDVPIQNNIYLIKALEFSDGDSSVLSDAEIKGKIFYSSCVDVNNTLQKRGAKPLLNLIDEVGGWVLIMNSTASAQWNWDSWSFQDALTRIHQISEGFPLFKMYVEKTVDDIDHPRRNVLQAVPNGLTLGNYNNVSVDSAGNNVFSIVAEQMTEVSVLLGAQNDTTTFNAMIKVLEFEQKLFEIIKLFQQEFSTLKVSELQQLSPFINWSKYLQQLLRYTSYQLTGNETITLVEEEYFSRVSEFINTTLSSKDGLIILQNYLLWQFVHSYLPHLPKVFNSALLKIRQFIPRKGNAVEQLNSDMFRCVKETDKRLPFATGALYIRGKYSEESGKLVESLTSYIFESFKINMPSLPWIDQVTAKAATEKADACRKIIGYPEFLGNKTYMNTIYQKVPIREDSYFENIVALVKFQLSENLVLLGKENPSDPISRGEYSLTQVNAAYASLENEMIIPAGFIQRPVFDHNFPNYINFGKMGTVVGHELTHGFDNSGRMYNKDGILSDWWSQTSVENFKKLSQCFVDQYSNYSVYGQNVGGRKTLGENISDNGGLKASFHAYLNWAKDRQQELLLPALNLTQEQFFFVAFAQLWCDNPSESYIKTQIATNEHSPDSVRLIGTVSNSREFSQHFKCSPGQPMNPIKKCEIW